MRQHRALVIIFCIFIFFLLILACSISFPSPKKEVKFLATTMSLERGECTYLFWEVDEGKNVKLNGELVSAVETRYVCPVVSTTYILSYETSDGWDSSQVLIQVNEQGESQKEVSIDLWADSTTIAKGECTELHWRTTGGPVRINGIDVDPSGDSESCLEQSKEYTLVVGEDLLSKTITINVQGESEKPESGFDQQPQPPAPPKEEPPLTFTFSPDFAPIYSELTINLSRPANVGVYFEGKSVAKKTSNGGKTFTVTVPPGFSCGYIELKGDGISVKSDKVLFSDTAVIVYLRGSTDLAVTDLYPDNQPIGEVYARITNRGPIAINRTQINLVCSAEFEPRPGGIVKSSPPAASVKHYLLTIKHNETQIFDTGIKSDTDSFFNNVTCLVRPSEDDYYGIFDNNVASSMQFAGFSYSFSTTCTKYNVTKSFDGIELNIPTGTKITFSESNWDNNTYFERIP